MIQLDGSTCWCFECPSLLKVVPFDSWLGFFFKVDGDNKDNNNVKKEKTTASDFFLGRPPQIWKFIHGDKKSIKS